MICKNLKFKQYSSITLLLFFAFNSTLFSQENACAFPESNTQSFQPAGFQGLKFFDENDDCEPLTLKCNFVIINRNDGTGSLSPNSPFWATWAQLMNQKLASITDQAMCSTGYPMEFKGQSRI